MTVLLEQLIKNGRKEESYTSTHPHVFKGDAYKEGNNMTTVKMNNCFVTKDYKLFKKTRGNRPIKNSHVERIKKAIAAKDLKLPILVTKDMDIRDGHHTFQARKALGLDIYYIVMESDDAFDMALINANRAGWTYENHLGFFCAYQRKDYMILRSKIKEYHMPIQEALTIFSGRPVLKSEVTSDFKEGRFKIPAGALSGFDRIAKEMTYINAIMHSTVKLRRGFIRSYLVSSRHPDWDFTRFKAAMRSKGARLLGAVSTYEYVKQFHSVYNAGLKPSKKINLLRFFEDKEYEVEKNRIVH